MPIIKKEQPLAHDYYKHNISYFRHRPNYPPYYVGTIYVDCSVYFTLHDGTEVTLDCYPSQEAAMADIDPVLAQIYEMEIV